MDGAAKLKEQMTPERYLERIGLAGIEEPGLDFLERLVEAHLTTVPFENLDIMADRKIFLQEALVFDKIVLGDRGGCCYELNTLFRWLLIRLGFSVDRVSGRVHNTKTGAFGPEFDHLALIVHLERDYLVDVGFGAPLVRPLGLPEDEVREPGGRSRLRPEAGIEDRYLVESLEDGHWRIKYGFSSIPRRIEEFQEMNVFHQTSRDSILTRGIFCTIAIDGGWMNLFGHTLTIFKDGKKEKVELPNSDQRDRLLEAHFRIRGL